VLRAVHTARRLFPQHILKLSGFFFCRHVPRTQFKEHLANIFPCFNPPRQLSCYCASATVGPGSGIPESPLRDAPLEKEVRSGETQEVCSVVPVVMMFAMSPGVAVGAKPATCRKARPIGW